MKHSEKNRTYFWKFLCAAKTSQGSIRITGTPKGAYNIRQDGKKHWSSEYR